MIRLLNHLLDQVFRIDANAVLNDGITAQTSDSGVAADIKRALTMLKAEAYDPTSAIFDYAQVHEQNLLRIP
jgi:hypothetical protein